MKKKLAKVVLFLLIHTFVLLGQNVDSLDGKLKEIKTKYDVSGMSVIVIRNNQVVFSKGYGIADHTRQIPVNSDSTLFRIASISKSITGTALLQLYEKGKFKINEDISRYLGYQVRNPRYPDDSVTFIHLLTHTSGLRDGSWYDIFLSASYGNNIPYMKDLFTPGTTYYTTSMWTTNKPGASFEYCNFSFGILGTLVEKISNERFDIYCRKNIFLPLGMNGSFNVQDIPDINKLAAIYRRSGGSWVAQTDNYQGIKPQPRNLGNYTPGDNGLVFSPQGGCRTSALDLSKFMMAHMNGGIFNGKRILDDSTTALMHRQHWSGSGLGGFYKKKGLSFHITDDLIPGKTMIGHSGEAYGLLSDMYFDKDYRFGIIFIINGGSASGGSFFYGIEEEVLRNSYDIMIKNVSGLKNTGQNTKNFELKQNFPNPFNPSTVISFLLPVFCHVILNVYDIQGREVAKLFDENKEPGNHSVLFTLPEKLSSGLYLFQLRAGSFLQTKKMMVIR